MHVSRCVRLCSILLAATFFAPFVRAEIRRPDDVVVSPVDDMPAAQMVALTNPIFLT